MPARKKIRGEKLGDSEGFPKVCPIDAPKSKRWDTGTFVIPSPLEVDALIRQVRCDRVTTIYGPGGTLAKRHGTTIARPLTAGIFAWIAAHEAAENESAGKTVITSLLAGPEGQR